MGCGGCGKGGGGGTFQDLERLGMLHRVVHIKTCFVCFDLEAEEIKINRQISRLF